MEKIYSIYNLNFKKLCLCCYGHFLRREIEIAKYPKNMNNKKKRENNNIGFHILKCFYCEHCNEYFIDSRILNDLYKNNDFSICLKYYYPLCKKNNLQNNQLVIKNVTQKNEINNYDTLIKNNSIIAKFIIKNINNKIIGDITIDPLYNNYEYLSDKNVYYTAPLAKQIMKCAAENNDTFMLEGSIYELLEYTSYENESKYNEFRIKLVEYHKLKNKTPIIIMKNQCHCRKCRNEYGFDKIETVTALVETLKKNIVKIDLQLCTLCKKFFVDDESLKLYEKKYGVLFFERIWDENNNDFIGEYIFPSDSILSRYGYIADINKQSDEIRQMIIIRIIDLDKKNKSKIKETLSRFISQRGERCYYAVDLWKNDLLFVNRFNENEQTKYENFYFKQNK